MLHIFRYKNSRRDVRNISLIIIYNRVVSYLAGISLFVLEYAFEYMCICHGILNASRDVRYISISLWFDRREASWVAGVSSAVVDIHVFACFI